MTRKQKEWAALAGVRAAVKGWAFADESKLPRYIAQAEAQAKLVPPEYAAAADALIQPLREELA